MIQDEIISPKSNTHAQNLATIAIALLRHQDRKLQIQAKQLVKTNKKLARDVFCADVDGWTPIHACAQRGSKKLLKTMLRAGVDVNLRMGQPEGLASGCTLLHIASDRRDTKLMEFLLARGADVNASDSLGRTPLFYANRSVSREAVSREAVRLLLDCGARAGNTGVDCIGLYLPQSSLSTSVSFY